MNVLLDTSDEPLRAVDFASTDALLRDDVKTLGALVGEILAEQRGPGFLDDVERLRRAAIRRREAQAPIGALAEVLADIDLDQASDLVRAFATYFQAVNLAERVHRIRRRRDYERAGATAQPDSLKDVLQRLKNAGVGLEEISAWLSKLDIEPVFTAHPTEAVRRTLLEKESVIFRCLIADLDAQRTPHEREVDLARLRMALTAGWQTADASHARPRVQDEFEHVGFYLGGPLYRIVPVFYEVFESALNEVYGESLPLPTMLRFGS
ncbi:MAG: phosphoenolpyruvate carboxylase, partial [Lysobacter sp.]|nr:phosphoenolpyruvate carboxylase [Lysobacter sp.]